MSRFAVSRKLGRAVALYGDEGIQGICSHLWLKARRLAGRDGSRHAEWLRQKSLADEAFDAKFGTRTGGIQEIFDFDIIGRNARYGLSHIATDPASFAEAVGHLNIDFAAHTFIDLGSGKGRALMLAAGLPFRRIIGVEFAAELHEAAQANVAAFAQRGGDASRIALCRADASTYAFPIDPLVIYLFNPFGSKIVRSVAENAMSSWRSAPRSLQVVYANPVHVSEFADAGWHVADHGGGCVLLTPQRDRAPANPPS